MTTLGAEVVLDGVSRAYGSTTVLDDVTLTIKPGELVGLTGPSGSGKTTLLQLIGSLDRPTRGRILVDGVSVGELNRPAAFRRSTVGFVFQLHYLLAALSAQANVELPLVAAGVPHRQRAARATELLAEVGLAGREKARPSELSGGERQRVAIARALAGRPRLILADEPTGSLDSASSRRIWQLLSDVRDHDGTTMIVASHEAALSEHTDRTVQLIDGRVQPADSPRPSEAPSARRPPAPARAMGRVA